MIAGIANAESRRLEQDARRQANWKRWGSYLPERQWGTVREDYSADGNCWEYFPHDHARSRAYRWGEDGLLGITDRECRLCFAMAMWNGRDPILKERLFGLTNHQGNHGEDVKELYFYLDNTPTHSYMKGLYKYPQREYPYTHLVQENARRGRQEPEYEILDTGVFDDNRYFDVFVEYAKNSPNDLLIRITVANRASKAATLHLLPTVWFRNSWSWGCVHEGCWPKPCLKQRGKTTIAGHHATLGHVQFDAEPADDTTGPILLFTENETNQQRLHGADNDIPYVKDAFHRYVIQGEVEAVNPKSEGTKAAAYYLLELPPRSQRTIRLRLGVENEIAKKPFGEEFDQIFSARIGEAEEFYASRIPPNLIPAEKQVMRQAFAGLLWSRQYYNYVVEDWLKGDPLQPPPPPQRWQGRNHDWIHLFNRDVLSMPDKWEYPWYAAWDLAFHMIPTASVDPQSAKKQLLLYLREWYMHPSGQLPAYEFALDDVNPPVHAWACWRVYKMTGPRGQRDHDFLARAFQKLLLNFTWWVNRKDIAGKHIFSGGFLGLDNVAIFDRSQPLPSGRHLGQADATAWMAFYCATMLSMALELATIDNTYEDIASKFFEHFVAIADAINTLGGTGLWDDKDGFYYDQLRLDSQAIPLRVRSVVGLIPLLAVEVLEERVIDKLPGFKKRMQWFLEYRKDLARHITYLEHCHRAPEPAQGPLGLYLLAIPSREKLQRVLKYLLDESEFLSAYGIRSLSAYHRDHPYTIQLDGAPNCIRYTPGDSDSALVGGNSNWRGPIWFPVNYLIIEALERYHRFYGDDLTVEFPSGSGRRISLRQVACELAGRLCRLFLPEPVGLRPCHGRDLRFATDPYFKDLILFYECFHGDTGRGLGASHQTGWTSLVTRLLEMSAQHRLPSRQKSSAEAKREEINV